MSVAQLETRLEALQDEYRARIVEHAQWVGAVKEAQHLAEQMTPGIDHERLATRLKQLQQEEQKGHLMIKHVEGGLKETLYWIHQTPEGSTPAEHYVPPSELAQELQVELNGHKFDQALSEGDLSAHAALGEPEMAGVN